jgi:hypothetical protein
MITSYTATYYIAFGTVGLALDSEAIMETILSSACAIDIVTNFFLAYYNDNDNLITDGALFHHPFLVVLSLVDCCFYVPLSYLVGVVVFVVVLVVVFVVVVVVGVVLVFCGSDLRV